MRKIEFVYDRSISAYFSFIKYLTNSGLFILFVYAYLLISHIFIYDGDLYTICSGTLCFTLYFSFSDDEKLAYSITLMLFIGLTVFTTLAKWIRSDAYRIKAQVYGGNDAKYKKFAAITFNSWDYSTAGEIDTFDSRVNLANLFKATLEEA